MLDLRAPFTLPDLPGITIYRDDENRRGFYAWPEHPRVVGASGRYDLRLVVHGRDAAGTFVPTGGMLALTTGLELTEAEQQRLRALLVAHLTPPAQHAAGTVVEPDMLSLECLDGAAELRLPPNRTIAGTPSLYGGNHCVFSVSFDGAAIGELLRAWESRLEGATIAYSLTVRARPAPTTLSFTGPVMPADARPGDYVTRVTL